MPEAWVRSAGDPAGQAAVSRALAEERFRGGYGDQAPLASSLVRASLAAGSRAEARGLAELAVEAAPGDPRCRLRLSRELLRGGEPAAALREAVRGLWSAARDPWLQLLWSARWALSLWAATGLALAALLLLSAASCGTLLYHDYADAFPKTLRRFTPAAFALLTGASLWGLGVGPLGVLVLPALALGLYGPPRTRWALTGCLVLFCVSFTSAAWVARLTEGPGQRAWALYRVAKGDSGAELQRDLEVLFPGRPHDALVARSLVARRAGRYGEALGLLSASPGASTGLEKGNLHFLLGQLAEARREYEGAAAAAPRDPSPWFNLHVIHLRRLALAEADRALEHAQALDAGAVQRFQKSQPGSAEVQPISTGLRLGSVWDEFLSGTGEGESWPRAFWQGLFLPTARVGPLHAAALVLALAWAASAGKRDRLSRRCGSCGAVICPRCTSRRLKGSDQCPACWALASQKTGDSTERARQQQVAALWRERTHRRRRRTWALLPGWSDFFAEGSVVGLAWGVVWAVAGGRVVAHLLAPLPDAPWAPPTAPWLSGGLLIALHLWGLRRALAAAPHPARR